MTDRPILYSSPMVRAVLARIKRQTRRVAKLTEAGHVKEPGGHRRWHTADFDARLACPYGQPSDRLWVRENGWERPERTPKMMREGADTWARYYYDADQLSWQDLEDFKAWGFKRRPSIHMPRWASRITLEIVAVRLERLQDITEADCIAEGCSKNDNGYYWGGPHPVSGLKQMATAKSAYRDLWESINGSGSWDLTPLVWVVEFKLVEAS